MPCIKFAKWFKRGVFVMEDLDEYVSEFPSFCGGREKVADPSVIGAEAAARGFCGGVEDSEFIIGGELGDEVGVFDDGEAGIAAVSSVDEQFEKLFPEGGVGCLHEGTTARDAGKGLELAGPQELDVPVFNAGTFKPSFAIGAEVDFNILRYRSVELGPVAGSICIHPLLDGGGGKVTNTVRNGRLQARNQLGNNGVFVGGVHRIGSANHQNKVDVEMERFESGDEFCNVARMGGREERNLDAGGFDRGSGHDFLHAGNRGECAVRVTRQTAIGIGNEASDKLEVGGDDSEFNAGFDLDGGRHNGVSWGLIELERDAGHPDQRVSRRGGVFNSNGFGLGERGRP